MKRMIQLATLACFTLLCGVCFIGCSDDAIVETSSVEKTYQPFRLTASQETPSRLALGQDGLSVTWEPGDQLVLVKKDRSIVPIYMNAELDEPSTSATFVSETGVPAGEYWVIYNYNDDLVYSHHGFSNIEDINNGDKLVLWGELTIAPGDTNATIALQHIYSKVRVELQNMPSSTAHYRIGMYASKTGFPIYQQLTQNGIVNADYYYDFNTNNNIYEATNRRYHHIRFGNYVLTTHWDEGLQQEITTDKTELEKNSVLLLPADVSGGTVYFYILDGNDCYEIAKSNLKFDAGRSYKVGLDMATAKKTSLSSTNVTLPGETYSSSVFQLKTVEDCRHAAYRGNKYDKYMLMNDIDFTGNTYLPITASHILGNTKTLKNVSIEWDEEDYVGLVKYEWDDMSLNGFASLDVRSQKCTFTDLTLENVCIKGSNYVGALSGTNVMVDNCKLKGESSIVATGDNVGGLVGCNYLRNVDEGDKQLSISDSFIEGDCTIEGRNYVGGIVGKCESHTNLGITLNSSLRMLNSCSSAATVTATGDYAGGIFGVIGNSNGSVDNVQFASEGYSLSLFECINTGEVSGQNYVGGIGGSFALNGGTSIKDKVSIMNSASEGEIEGQNYVGGIVGVNYASINTCYSIGKVSANGFVGGIVGDCYNYSFGESRIVNCYSMADITVGQGGNAGGLIGYAHWGGAYGYGVFLSNSYFAGTNNTTGYGLIGFSEGGCQINNCLTTLASSGNLGTRQANRDVNGDGVIDAQDVISDNVSDSFDNVQSILQNLNILNANGEEAYSNVVWPGYSYDCVKFLTGLTGNVVAPGFGTEIIY